MRNNEIDDFKRVGNLEVDIDKLMRSRTIGYKIDEIFSKRFVGSISKWQVVNNRTNDFRNIRDA